MSVLWSIYEERERILNTLKAFTRTSRSLGCSENLLMWAKPWSNIPFKFYTGISIIIFAFTVKALAKYYRSDVDSKPSISR